MDKNMNLVSSLVARSRALILLGVVSSIGLSCSRSSTPYDRLCHIYEGYEGKPTTAELAVEISQAVEKQLPEIYGDYHVVMSSGTSERYEMLRMLARERVQQNEWTCDAIRRRYPPEPSH